MAHKQLHGQKESHGGCCDCWSMSHAEAAAAVCESAHLGDAGTQAVAVLAELVDRCLCAGRQYHLETLHMAQGQEGAVSSAVGQGPVTGGLQRTANQKRDCDCATLPCIHPADVPVLTDLKQGAIAAG